MAELAEAAVVVGGAGQDGAPAATAGPAVGGPQGLAAGGAGGLGAVEEEAGGRGG